MLKFLGKILKKKSKKKKIVSFEVDDLIAIEQDVILKALFKLRNCWGSYPGGLLIKKIMIAYDVL